MTATETLKHISGAPAAILSAAPVFAGIDVACAQRKRLPICIAAFAQDRLEPSRTAPEGMGCAVPLRAPDAVVPDDGGANDVGSRRTMVSVFQAIRTIEGMTKLQIGKSR